MSRVLRGEIWRVRLNPTEGDEIQKARPCLIVSSDHVGKLRLRVVVPLTEWRDSFRTVPWMVQIDPDRGNGLAKASAADAFQVRSVSVQRFVEKCGVVSDEQLQDVVAAVGIVLEITP